MAEPITVLHVDDDSSLGELTATYLERIDDRFSVRTETTGRDALERLSTADFDCLVSDYQMPGTDGLELLEAVREQDADIPFILYTSRGSEEVASDAISAGATDYLRKGGGSDRHELLANRITNAVETYRSRQRAADLERVRTLVREINQSLVRASSRRRIEADVCDILSEADPYGFAWIGNVDPETGHIEPSTWVGIDSAYFEDTTITVDQGVTGQGPGGRAVRNRTIEVSQDVQNDPTFEPWRDSIAEKDIQSVAAVPIERDEELFGLLVVGAERAFDATERQLFADLSDDIAHAMDRLRTSAAIEQERNQHVSLFANAPDPIMAVVFEDGTPVVDGVNPAFEATFGYSAADITGQSVAEALVPEARRSRHQSLSRQVFEGNLTEAEVCRTTTRGERRFRLRVIPLDVTDVSTGAYAWYTDVTEQNQYEERLERTNEASRNLMTATTEPAVAEVTVGAAQDIVDDALTVMWSYDAAEDSLDPLAATDSTAAEGQLTEAFDRSAVVSSGTLEMGVFQDGEMRVIEEYRALDDRAYPDLPLGTAVLAPLGEYGQLFLGVRDVEAVDDTTRDLILMLCQTAEAALDRLHRERTLSELNEVTRELVQAASVEEVAAIAAAAGSDILGLPFTHIYLTDEDHETLQPASVSEQTREQFGELPEFQRGVGMFWDVLESGETRVYDDVQEEPTLASGLPFRGAVIAPLGEFGVFASGSLTPGEFDPFDRKHASILAAATESALDGVERERRLREHEQELKAARNRFRSVFEQSNDAIVIFDPGTDEILEANPQATDLLGYSREELLSLGPSDIHPGQMTQFREFLTQVRTRGKGRTDRLSCVTKSDEDVPAEISASTLEFDGQESVLALIRDVSELRSYERELERQNERLERFASVLSHDLRNPLNVAQGRVDLALEETGNSHLEPAQSSLDRMEEMIADILTLTRAGNDDLETEPVALDSLTERCWRTVDTDDAELKVLTGMTVRADPGRLRHVFENLIRNAVEHGSTSSRPNADNTVEHGSTGSQTRSDNTLGNGGAAVKITVGALPDGTGFYVEDTGPGIPPDERATVFEQGYSTADDGTGFGLSIVQETVTAHGWEIRVTESAAGGARFEIATVATEV